MDIFFEYFRAFWVGGLICVIGQLLICYTKLTPARILVSFVVFGVILGALGVYDSLAEYAGAGASVPLIGFGSLIASGTLDAIREKGIVGILSGGLTASAAGIAASIFFGFLTAVIFKSKANN